MKLRKLYSDPPIFDPITFHNGLNIILGDRNLTKDKTNGVGKSLSIDFINFCLLKKYTDCRISLIPNNILKNSTICLDLQIKEYKLTIKRSTRFPNSPIFIVNNKVIKFNNLDEAKDYLNYLYFNDESHYPSIRALLGPIIRDESSEFKSIEKPYNTNLRIPTDYSPHLYFFGLDTRKYKEIKKTISNITESEKIRRKFKKDALELTGYEFEDARVAYNNLNSEINKLKEYINDYDFISNYEELKTSILKIENDLKLNRSEISVLNHELEQIDAFSDEPYINEAEICETYGIYKKSLGDLIKKELNEVISFKKKIDNFQHTLLTKRKEIINNRILKIKSEVSGLENLYKNKINLIESNDGALSTLKISFQEYQNKIDQQSYLLSFIKSYDQNENKITQLRVKKNNELLMITENIESQRKTIKNFENVLLNIYGTIMDNNKCYFNIETTNSNDVYNFILRIADDGSHSINREKVFLYDISLLICKKTSSRHPGFLIHDNIFDMDQDTSSRNLAFIYDHFSDVINSLDKQYILTLSIDKFDLSFIDEDAFDFVVVERFTKNKKFLKKDYSEIPAKK